MPVRNVPRSVNEGHLVNFPQRGDARANFGEAAFAQRGHAFFPGDALDLRGGPAVDDHFADAVGQIQEFANGGASVEAAAGALEASGALAEHYVGPMGRIEPRFIELFRAEFPGPLAIIANHAYQALGHDAIERGDEVVRFDAHVDEAADDVGHVVGVDGGEDQVPGESGLDGDLGGFLVANFADHDFVGVVAQDGAQAAGESEAFFLVDGNLGDALELILDGIFDGNDLVLVAFDFVNGGIQRGGLAGSGRPGDQDHAVRLADVAAETFCFLVGEADDVETQALEFFGKGLLVEDAEHGVFSVAGGHDGDTQIDIATLILHAEAAVLGNAALGDIEVAQDLDAGDDGGMPVLGDGLHGVLQDAVDAVLDGDFGVARFDVNVAGTALEGGEDDGFDQADNGASSGVAREAVAGNGFFAFFFFLGDGQSEGFGGLLEDALGLFGAFKDVADLARGGHLDGEFAAEKELQLVGERHLAGFGDGDGQHVVLNFQRHEVVAEHQVRLNGAKEFRVDALLAQIDEGKPVTFGQLAGVLAFVGFFGR